MAAVSAHWPHFDATWPDDPLDLPLDRFFNRVIAWFKDRMKPSDYDSWWLQINIPMDGEEPDSGPWSEDAMASAFRAAKERLT